MSANVNLTLIARLKQEFTDASNAFKNSPNDVLAALRLIAAGFNAGQEAAVEPLALNPIFIKAAPAMVNIASDRAEAVLLAWSSMLWQNGLNDAAIQILTDCAKLPQFSSNTYGNLQDRLRTFHYYYAAKGYMEVRPTAQVRIEHLKAILDLGFELGYVYKFLAECYHEIGDDAAATAHLQKALAINPDVAGAKTISKALGLLVAEPRKQVERKQTRDFLFRQAEDIASNAQVLQWLRDENWDELLCRGDENNYAVRIRTELRSLQAEVAHALGECKEPRARALVGRLLTSAYWDVRKAAILALSKIGDESTLGILRQIRDQQNRDNPNILELIAYVEARLGPSFTEDQSTLIANAKHLLRIGSDPASEKFGTYKWRLEKCWEECPDAMGEVLPLLLEYCLRMGDYARPCKLLQDKYELIRSGALSDQITTKLAEVFVQAGDRTAALECIRLRYARMNPAAQSYAQDVLWEALNGFELFGEKNYMWALDLLLASTVAETTPDQLLPKLHRMARIMEPIGQTEMGTWIRHTLRAEAPGHWFGDGHDRLNYFRYPQFSDAFQQELNAIFAKYKPLISAALTRALQLPTPLPAPPIETRSPSSEQLRRSIADLSKRLPATSLRDVGEALGTLTNPRDNSQEARIDTLRALLLKPDTPLQEFGEMLGINITPQAVHEMRPDSADEEVQRECIQALLVMSLTDDWLTFESDGRLI